MLASARRYSIDRSPSTLNTWSVLQTHAASLLIFASSVNSKLVMVVAPNNVFRLISLCLIS